MQKINIYQLYRKFKRKYANLNNAVVFVAFVIAASWVWGSLQVMQRNYSLQKELDDKSRELILAQLDTENAQLQQRYYQTREYQDLAVRERLGLVSPGESVLILPENSQSAKNADVALETTPTVSDVKQSNFVQWMNFLFGGNSKNISGQ